MAGWTVVLCGFGVRYLIYLAAVDNREILVTDFVECTVHFELIDVEVIVIDLVEGSLGESSLCYLVSKVARWSCNSPSVSTLVALVLASGLVPSFGFVVAGRVVSAGGGSTVPGRRYVGVVPVCHCACASDDGATAECGAPRYS